MTTNTVSLIPRRERGWRMGLANMLAKENGGWWRTRRWWFQCLLAVFLLNGTMALNLKGGGIENAGLGFLMVSVMAGPIASVILGQDSILGEKHSGTAAWVLSKPIWRPAFILEKLIAYGLGLLVAWVVLPGAIAYFQLAAKSQGQISAPGFIAAMGLVYLNLLFYLTLGLMFAMLFNGRGPGLGIALLQVVIWLPPVAEPIIKFAPWLLNVTPWNLLMPFGNTKSPLAGYLMLDVPLPTVAPIIATAVWCVLFTSVAIWRIRREEF